MDEISLPPLEENLPPGMDMGISLPDEPVVANEANASPEQVQDIGSVTEEDFEMEDEEPVSDETESFPEEGSETPESENEEEDYSDVDFEALFAAVDDAQEAIDSSEEALSSISSDSSNEDIANAKEEIRRLGETVKNFETQLRKLSKEKYELSIKNMELEAFGGDFTDPQVIVLNKHLERAKNGDERSVTKVTSILKNMLAELT